MTVLDAEEALSSLVECIRKMWSPGRYRLETRYRDDLLYNVLTNEKVKERILDKYELDINAIKEGREGCDIRVMLKAPALLGYEKYNFCIELKKDFDNRSKLDRLMGQLSRYKERYDGILLVFVGKSRKDLVLEVRRRAREILHIKKPLEYVIMKSRSPTTSRRSAPVPKKAKKRTTGRSSRSSRKRVKKPLKKKSRKRGRKSHKKRR